MPPPASPGEDAAAGAAGSPGAGGTPMIDGGSAGTGGMGGTVEVTNAGSYTVGEMITMDTPVESVMPAGPEGCTSLVGAVRDFKGSNEPGGHPDFERAFGGGMASVGLVGATLGADKKPTYTARCEEGAGPPACAFGQQTTSKTAFDQWYRVRDGVNQAFVITFELQKMGGAASVGSTRFFPVDGRGFGMSGKDQDGKMRNFAFTTELHTKFKYNGGEYFTFAGDDDLWVFINGKLVVDLGGLHPPLAGSVDLGRVAATVGITPGNTYDLDLFHAERHTNGSNFYVITNLTFVDCGRIIP